MATAFLGIARGRITFCILSNVTYIEKRNETNAWLNDTITRNLSYRFIHAETNNTNDKSNDSGYHREKAARFIRACTNIIIIIASQLRLCNSPPRDNRIRGVSLDFRKSARHGNWPLYP